MGPGPSWESLGITPRPSRRLKPASVWIRARPLESLALPGTSLAAWTLVKRSPSISSPPSPTQTFFVSGVAEQNLSEQRGTGGEGGGLSNFGDLPAVSWRGELKQGALRLLRRWALSACSGASHGEARGFLHLGKCGGGNAHQGGLGSGQLAVPHMGLRAAPCSLPYNAQTWLCCSFFSSSSSSLDEQTEQPPSSTRTSLTVPPRFQPPLLKSHMEVSLARLADDQR